MKVEFIDVIMRYAYIVTCIYVYLYVCVHVYVHALMIYDNTKHDNINSHVCVLTPRK